MVEHRNNHRWQKLNRKFVFFFAAVLFSTAVFAQFNVTIEIQNRPATHKTDTLFVAGNFNGWNPGLSNYRFSQAANHNRIELTGIAKGLLEYKITRGSWTKVECAANGASIGNRIAQISSDTTLYIVLPQKPCNAVLDYIRSQTHY